MSRPDFREVGIEASNSGVSFQFNLNDPDFVKEFPSRSQRETIVERMKAASRYAVEVGGSGVKIGFSKGGWYYGGDTDFIGCNPQDLLDAPDYKIVDLMAHEGGHRKITRWDDIDDQLANLKGYPFFANCMENPRVDSYVLKNFPGRIGNSMKRYDGELENDWGKAFDEIHKKVGYHPKFVLAGVEYFRQWQQDVQEGIDPSRKPHQNLPDDVKQVITKTINAARAAWEMDLIPESTEEEILKAAHKSNQISWKKIWPEFRKLIEQDEQTQLIVEYLNGLPQGFDGSKIKLSGNEREELNELLDSRGDDQSADLDNLSDGLRRKLLDHIGRLPRKELDQLKEAAEKSIEEIAEIADQVNEGGQPGGGNESQRGDTEGKIRQRQQDQNHSWTPPIATEATDQPDPGSSYEAYLSSNQRRYKDVVDARKPQITQLTNQLRDILLKKLTIYRSSGSPINIHRRILEDASGISPMESKAWERRRIEEKDAITVSILIDLSSSMAGLKISGALEGVVVVTEALQMLHNEGFPIEIEILGFNSGLYEFKTFKEQITPKVTEKIGGIEYSTGNSTDDGWALDQAGSRFPYDSKNRTIVILSDGESQPSAAHNQPKFSIPIVVRKLKDMGIEIVGIGIGPGTNHVKNYGDVSYPNQTIDQLPNTIARAVEKIVEK